MLTRIQTLDIFPVGLPEIKMHLRLDPALADEDVYLRSLAQAAAGFVEEYLGRSLLTQSWRLVWDKEKPLPPQLSISSGDICSVSLPYPPLRAILGVNRLMGTGERKPIRRHCLEMNHQVPRLVFAQVPEPVEIEFEAGYGDRSRDIPALIRQALLMIVGDFYENRDSGAMPPNGLVRQLLDSYRVVRLP